MAHYFREHLATPLFQFALKITDWAKGGPWIAAAALIYLGAQGWMAFAEETPIARAVSDYALALLASFVVGSVILHVIKIFLGRRRPRDEFEHGLYGFRWFTWQLQYDSFPSGHSMTIFSRGRRACRRPSRCSRRYGSLLAFGLSLTRAMLTAHFLADVMVGRGHRDHCDPSDVSPGVPVSLARLALTSRPNAGTSD